MPQQDSQCPAQRLHQRHVALHVRHRASSMLHSNCLWRWMPWHQDTARIACAAPQLSSSHAAAGSMPCNASRVAADTKDATRRTKSSRTTSMAPQWARLHLHQCRIEQRGQQQHTAFAAVALSAARLWAHHTCSDQHVLARIDASKLIAGAMSLLCGTMRPHEVIT